VRANLLAALIGMLGVTACGGGGGSLANGGSGGGGGTTPTGSNVQAITVDSGPPEVASSNQPAINTAYTAVTVCSPGSTTNCQTIDHIQVDTGSSGLRILAPVLTISLPLQPDANGNVLAECVPFADGSSWGPIRQADVEIAGETATQQEVQVIGDAAYPIPTTCSASTQHVEDSVTSFGANGILGVGPFITDCGSSCDQAGNDPGTAPVYFACTAAAACSPSANPNRQVSNPVASFTTDNNGVIIQLPNVAAAGAQAVSGYLIFGIGTQSNNALNGATVISLGSNGLLTTNYNQLGLQTSFIDSGSNAYFFPDKNIVTCTGNEAPFYCPSSTLTLSATIVSQLNGVSAPVQFNVANANSLFTSSAVLAAASNLAANSSGLQLQLGGTNGSDLFDWGLPFYFGRSVYTAIENRNTSGGTGPYFAF
jgi:Protein of unknown function (DUF3443)